MALHLIPPGTRKGNRTYLARGSINNRVYEYNTYATDPKIAAKHAREIEKIIREDRKPVPDADKLTFADAARLYVEFRNPSRFDCQQIDKLLREIGRERVRDIRPADLHALALRLHPNDKPATRNRNVLRVAVTILHHAANAGLCPWIRVKMFREPRPVTRALEPAAAAALINGAKPGAQRALLVWLFFQGSRISATLKLNWDQVDLKAKSVRLYNRKADRWETFPLHEATIAELRQINDREGRVFKWSDRSSLRRWLPALCARVGVEFTPHMARHTLGTMMAANGETLKAIMAALGHSTPSSSLRYQGADIEMVRAATARISLPIAGGI